jgi:hypothetical protein
MRAQATRRDQEDRPHPLRRACPTGAIASRNPIEGEKIPTPVRRLARIQGMKRKDYKEVSPEPKDYGGSDYSDDRSPSFNFEQRSCSCAYLLLLASSCIW